MAAGVELLFAIRDGASARDVGQSARSRPSQNRTVVVCIGRTLRGADARARTGGQCGRGALPCVGNCAAGGGVLRNECAVLRVAAVSGERSYRAITRRARAWRLRTRSDGSRIRASARATLVVRCDRGVRSRADRCCTGGWGIARSSVRGTCHARPVRACADAGADRSCVRAGGCFDGWGGRGPGRRVVVASLAGRRCIDHRTHDPREGPGAHGDRRDGGALRVPWGSRGGLASALDAIA